jgi:hypothetical protein
MPDSGRHRALTALLKARFPNARVSSTYRPGVKGYHGSGDAIDIGSESMEIFNWLVATYPQSQEIIYTPGGARQIKDGKPHVYSAGVAIGHYDHIHWAWTGVGTAFPGTAIPVGNPVTDAVGAVTGVSSFVSFFTTPGLWARVGVALGGLLLILLGFARLTRQALSPMVKGAISGR